MIAAAVIITLLYVLLMLFLLYGFFQVPVFYGKNFAEKSTFSIVIPYRNEAENLPQLFKTFQKLKYPSDKFEIIAINDASEDKSAQLWENFRKENPEIEIKLLQNIHSSGSPKKDAIELAISYSKYNYILTTDADCELPTAWLGELDANISSTNAVAVAGPVSLKTEVSKMSFLEGFQELDFFSLQAASIGGFGVNIPFMCNGANFCYSKKAFLEVDGFTGNNDVASGDDIFLLEKFRKKGFKISFLKSCSATVHTAPVSSWKQLFLQRVRWAAKTSAYKSPFAKGMGVLVFLMNLQIVILALLASLGYTTSSLLLFTFLLKFNVDFALIFQSAKFFDRERAMKTYFFSSIIYPFFTSAVAIYSIFAGYKWKGRSFKK